MFTFAKVSPPLRQVKYVQYGLRYICTKQHWFFATDVPKTDPYQSPEVETIKKPQKFIAFSKNDSDRLEKSFQEKDNSKKEVAEVIPVKEDYLFHVDLKNMELIPSYWKGPTYEVRRGTWFNSLNQPLDSRLAQELEKKYNEVDFTTLEKLKKENNESANLQDVFELEGDYEEGKFVLFIDKKIAFLLQAIDCGKFQLNFLRSNIGQSIPINAMKLIRGYDSEHGTSNKERSKNAIEKGETATSKPKSNQKDSTLGKIGNMLSWESNSGILSRITSAIYDSSSTANGNGNDNKAQYMKNEMEQDYYDEESTSSENDKTELSNYREVNHLILSVHGIGQTLGKTYEYVNFVHTVNILRSNMKKLYNAAEKLQNLNKLNRYKDWQSNSNVQVLPITWRHSINFKTESDPNNEEDPELPTLDEVTIDGIVPFRKLLADGIFDILLYGEPYYKKMIMEEVTKQLNDVYERFKTFNPNFNGEVHLVGHSLGSMILFDILSKQDKYPLNFEVKNFFSIGSPIGILKLIQRTRIGTDKKEKIEDKLKLLSPKCSNLYNVFHVCDPVAYRIEPLIDRRLAKYEHSYIPHWSESDNIASKVIELGGKILKEIPINQNTEDNGKDENGNKIEIELPVDLKKELQKLNYTGRIDYALPSSFLEVDVLSALSSHVSYFEEPDIAGFILKEILAGHKIHEKVNVKVSKLYQSRQSKNSVKKDSQKEITNNAFINKEAETNPV
ncbi:hypothetical protein RNJ44_01390 [Nakaseomyces bracarensis]|uniref:DDHD domain-containing protein n=1 Tax=Nakaseomyces bracarensis TaxID=273131 RepID=A0ABR4NPJ9_9SACH